MIPSRKSSIQTDFADSSTVEEKEDVSSTNSSTSSASSDHEELEKPEETSSGAVEEQDEATNESPVEPEAIESYGEALATSPEESPLEPTEKMSFSVEATTLELNDSSEQTRPVLEERGQAKKIEIAEEVEMVAKDTEETLSVSEAQSELKESIIEKEEHQASFSLNSDATNSSVETAFSVVENDDTQDSTSPSLANIPSLIEPDSTAEIPEMSDVTSSEAPLVEEKNEEPTEEQEVSAKHDSDIKVDAPATIQEAVEKEVEPLKVSDNDEKSESPVVPEKSEDSSDGDKQIEKEEPITAIEEDENVADTEVIGQSSSDTESEPTVILPESTEAQVEMEEIDLASEIVKEVEERISKSEMEANNLKEVGDKTSKNEETSEPAIEKKPANEIAEEGEVIVQEVLAIITNDEEDPENTPIKPLRSKKSSTSSDNEEASAVAVEQETKNVKDELATPELIEDKLSDVRKIKKNKSRRKRDMVTCKCC